MKAEQIIRQLQAVLPKYTDYFSDSVSASSVTRSGSTVTVVTSSAHGLTTGQAVYIRGALSPNPISSLTRVGNVATAITTNSHDLTEGYQTTVNISGANQAEYNGTKTLLSVPNRTTFTFSVSGSPATPATGTIYLQEDKELEYNGRKIVSVVDPTTFTYSITATPESPAQGTISVLKGLRVSGAVNPERFFESYTQQSANKLWLIVVANDTLASKERRLQDDATYRSEAGQFFYERLIQNLQILLYIPSSATISARQERDLAEDIRPAIFKSLLGVKFDSGFTYGSKYQLTFVNDNQLGYFRGFYVHSFNFEAPYEIYREDTVDPPYSTAWRDFEIDWQRDLDDYVVRNIKGKLDA